MTRPLSTDTIPTPLHGRPRPGDVLSGKYRIERELGSGGMGVVYEVTHLAMPQARFAIKWLRPFDDEDGLRRFRREARISGAIRHRHVIEVYDVNIEESGSYLVMELLEGETLAARIERERGLHPTDACTIISQCLSGVAAAHAAGVIHRDIKPANMFLCSRPTDAAVHAKVLDFGVSRVLSGFQAVEPTLTHGAIIGTPAYMAPEQLQARECGTRTDIYALGATLYEALAGEPAFNAASHADLVVRIVTGNVTPLRRVVAGLDPGLSDVVMRAMHKDPERRFASVQTFAAALEPYLQPLAAHGAGLQTKTAPRALRIGWRALALGAGGVAVALGAVALLSAGFGQAPETSSSPASLSGAEPKASSRERDSHGDLVHVEGAMHVVPGAAALDSATAGSDPTDAQGGMEAVAPSAFADGPRLQSKAGAPANPNQGTKNSRGGRNPKGRGTNSSGTTSNGGRASAHEAPQPAPAEPPSPPAAAASPEQTPGRPRGPSAPPPLTLDSL